MELIKFRTNIIRQEYISTIFILLLKKKAIIIILALLAYVIIGGFISYAVKADKSALNGAIFGLILLVIAVLAQSIAINKRYSATYSELSSINWTINEEQIVRETERSTFKIYWGDIKKMKENKSFYLFWIKSGSVFWFRKSDLTDEQAIILNEFISKL